MVLPRMTILIEVKKQNDHSMRRSFGIKLIKLNISFMLNRLHKEVC